MTRLRDGREHARRQQQSKGWPPSFFLCLHLCKIVFCSLRLWRQSELCYLVVQTKNKKVVNSRVLKMHLSDGAYRLTHRNTRLIEEPSVERHSDCLGKMGVVTSMKNDVVTHALRINHVLAQLIVC